MNTQDPTEKPICPQPGHGKKFMHGETLLCMECGGLVPPSDLDVVISKKETTQAPAPSEVREAGREIWMLEVRGALDPRYWATSKAEAMEYVESRETKERPRLVRMVEAGPLSTNGKGEIA